MGLYLNIIGMLGGIIAAISFAHQGIIWAAFISIFCAGANFTFAIIKIIELINGDD